MTEDTTKKSQSLFAESELRAYKEPVLISACLLGIPCRWHGQRPKKRDKLIERLKKKYVLVPICPEQLGGMPTPRLRRVSSSNRRAGFRWRSQGHSVRNGSGCDCKLHKRCLIHAGTCGNSWRAKSIPEKRKPILRHKGRHRRTAETR